MTARCHRPRLGAMRGAAVTLRFRRQAPGTSRAVRQGVACGEIWSAATPRPSGVEEERLRGGDRKIEGCLYIETLRVTTRKVAGCRPFPLSASLACSAKLEKLSQASAISALISARSASIEIEALRRFEMPEGPAVAGVEALRQRADAVDRADRVAERHRAVGAHQRLVLLLGVDELGAGRHQAALEQRRETARAAPRARS